MKVLITEEQLKLIINESKELQLPAIVTIPSFCGGNLNNQGCKKYSETMAPYGTYSNSSGPDHRAKYVYPASMEEVKNTSDGIPVIFVQKLKYGSKNKGRGLKGNAWKRQAAKWYDKYINKESIKDKGIWNKSKEFFNATEIVRVTPENNHIFTHQSGSGDHPYENNNYVNNSAQPSLAAIGDAIGGFGYESTYRDSIHQQIMVDYVDGSTAPVGKSNHQEGFAIDLPKSKTGQDIASSKQPSNPFHFEDSSKRVNQVWTFFVFIGPVYGWYPFGAGDTVHFTYCKGHSSSDCNKATGNYALGIKALKESGSNLPEMLCSGGWNNQSTDSATYKLGVKVTDTSLKGFDLTRQWCKKYVGGELVIPEPPEEDEVDPITTQVPPLGSVKINGDNLIVNMGDKESKIGFRLYRKLGNSKEEIEFKKSNGAVSTGGQTEKSYGKNKTLSFSLPNLMSDTVIKSLPWKYRLYMDVFRIVKGEKMIADAVQTEDFIIDGEDTCPQCKILTGEEIDKYYREHYNEDPKSIEDFIDMEKDKIYRDQDNTRVDPSYLNMIDLNKIEFKKD
tara:strand:- start:5524 stop:7206 length:1683 start_codon:yes stop_codon:yes gene_type:complete